MCYVQLLSRLTSFKTMFVKPYFWSETTYNDKLNKLKAFTLTAKVP
jgi:hypothetical protein